ncbi:hypothetical protein QTJ16_004602 [Diplocarpon rosae]|uniref:Uncharacterized protein n=1 Tax=Diplocarpon rosae TaxID=946125 RepID=A0AAD9WCJ4_9HELO|nr:hypothetical protein QTJ16_004602 [Diplocarpon rosae]
MAGGYHSNSHTEISGKICEDCERIYRKNRHTDLARYCQQHLCPVFKDGIPCHVRKSKHQPRCERHLLPLSPPPKCNADGCQLLLEKSLHCPIHSCTFTDCPNYARPGQGIDYCDDHKCPDIACRSVKKRYELGDILKWAVFCRAHECQTPTCEAKKLEGKDYCQSHCCNMKSCPNALLPHLPVPFCIAHYEKLVEQRAASQREAELHAEQQAQELKEAKKREQQQKEDKRLARQLANEEKEELHRRNQQEALLRAQETDRARMEEEIKGRWQTDITERARREAEGESKERAERAEHESERRWEWSPQNNGEEFSAKAETPSRIGKRFETSPGAGNPHYFADSRGERTSYQDSSRGRGPYSEIPHVSKATPRAAESPRYPKTGRSRKVDCVHIHHDDDEAYQSADHEYMQPRPERDAGYGGAARDRYRGQERQYVTPDCAAYFYDRRSAVQESGAMARHKAFEGKRHLRNGW